MPEVFSVPGQPATRYHIDHLVSATEDGAEWSLLGWIFLPDGSAAYSGHAEFGQVLLSPLSCGWHRPDVAMAFPDKCHAENTGFVAHLILPGGLEPGNHILELVFSDEKQREVVRLILPFQLEHETPKTPAPGNWPVSSADSMQASYLTLLEKTLLGLPYTQGQESFSRRNGKDWPAFAHSMIGIERMHHLRACAETALREDIPGDFMETGVWRGGACILLRGVLHAWSDTLRKVWVADSFAGLPAPNPHKYPADQDDRHHTFAELAVSEDQVREHFRRYDLLDDQVRFLPGWFSETLPTSTVEQIAVLRLDGDMYESTIDALESLYPKLSPGGFCIIDDYGSIPGCRKAVRDYRAAHNILEPLAMIDWTGAWWRKST